MSFLGSLTGSDVGKATMNAAKENKELLNALMGRGMGYINTGEQKSSDALNTGIARFDPYAASGAGANTMLGNALGLNGAEGNEAATEAFQAGPGFQFTLDNALKAAERGASAGGMLASGNTLAALQDRGANVANQEYGSWLDRLSGLSGQGLTAAGAQQGGDTNLANLFQNTTEQRLGLDTGVTQGILGQNNQYAQGKEAQTAAKGSFLGGLMNTGLGMLGSFF